MKSCGAGWLLEIAWARKFAVSPMMGIVLRDCRMRALVNVAPRRPWEGGMVVVVVVVVAGKDGTSRAAVGSRGYVRARKSTQKSEGNDG